MKSRIKPRHVFGALVLIAQAPILAAFVAGWLISGLIYALALGVELARGHRRDWRQRQRFTRPEPSRSVTSAAFGRAAPNGQDADPADSRGPLCAARFAQAPAHGATRRPLRRC